ncbi:response regulator [Pseudocolwellia sp. HL-MZ7]|uniref:response regulator n=1 Tax=Pseudocolwellia sp. HL-MZ7 TaxID=3400627 RepID=UPI003CEE822E
MKPNPLLVGSRHPKVIMLVDNGDDTAGAANILANHIDEYRTIFLDENTTEYIHQTAPAVILFALSSIEKCVEYYKFLVEESELEHIHYSVLLCNNKESSLAFRCCMKGLFDNYFVFQPLYERLRLLMIVQSGLTETQADSKIQTDSEELSEKIDEELSALIDEGSKCKQNLLKKISQSREDISKVPTSDLIKDINDLDSPQELLNSINQDHVHPLLHLLEKDIRSSLDNIITQLLSQQGSIKEALPVKKQKSKGLITHVPSIKKRNNDLETTSNDLIDDELINEKLAENPKVPPEDNNTLPHSILVVEDNKLYRDMISNVLTKENYQVDEAEDGLCALNKIKENRYDLILMDLFMPNLDGLNATKKIRQLSKGIDTPVIALTGNKNKELVKKWANYGLKGYIIKPSTKAEILSVVKKNVGLSQEHIDA